MSFSEKKNDHIIYLDANTLKVKISHEPDVPYSPGLEVKDILAEAAKVQRTKETFLKDIYNPAVTKLLETIKEYNRANNAEYRAKLEVEEKKAKKPKGTKAEKKKAKRGKKVKGR